MNILIANLQRKQTNLGSNESYKKRQNTPLYWKEKVHTFYELTGGYDCLQMSSKKAYLLGTN